jgi:hypothetical protein
MFDAPRARMGAGMAAKFATLLFVLVAGVVCLLALPSYTGNGYIFLLFSVLANALLYFGFRKNAIFFDTFIGIFFWMGFWLKFTVRILFFDGSFSEATGAFDRTGSGYDAALLVSSCGISGLIFASILREKMWFNYSPEMNDNNERWVVDFYFRHRGKILTAFVFVFTGVAVSNIILGIYQKGAITQTVLPFGLNGVFKWLILFGLASFSAVVLRLELVAKRQITIMIIVLVLLESLSTNTSLLSRGMVLNMGAIAYGVFVACRLDLIRLSIKTMFISGVVFCAFFAGSVVVVNDLRGNGPGLFSPEANNKPLAEDAGVAIAHATPLFLNRWVGIEGVLAVSSSPRLGWDLWREAWQERYSETTMGFYDANLIESPYKDTDFSKHHHLSLPGILAFFFYPGSFVFLFCGMLFLGVLAAVIEVGVFKFGGKNLILCALISQVVAYRYVSFGYVPAQSYLLFGSVSLNILIIYVFYSAAGFFLGKNLHESRSAR